jgi:hypothetical protein
LVARTGQAFAPKSPAGAGDVNCALCGRPGAVRSHRTRSQRSSRPGVPRCLRSRSRQAARNAVVRWPPLRASHGKVHRASARLTSLCEKRSRDVRRSGSSKRGRRSWRKWSHYLVGSTAGARVTSLGTEMLGSAPCCGSRDAPSTDWLWRGLRSCPVQGAPKRAAPSRSAAPKAGDMKPAAAGVCVHNQAAA